MSKILSGFYFNRYFWEKIAFIVEGIWLDLTKYVKEQTLINNCLLNHTKSEFVLNLKQKR
jgi:hypothetical protein